MMMPAGTNNDDFYYPVLESRTLRAVIKYEETCMYVKCKPTESMSQLKKRICRITSIYPAHQRLMLNGKEMYDYCSFKDYGMRSYGYTPVIRLLVEHTLALIRRNNSIEFAVPVNSFERVWDVKLQISKRTGLVAQDMELYLKNERLGDYLSLTDYAVEHGSILDVVLSISGAQKVPVAPSSSTLATAPPPVAQKPQCIPILDVQSASGGAASSSSYVRLVA